MYKSFIKPLFDFLISLTALFILSPVLLLVTLFLFIANNGKPFFTQPRPGKNEKIFKVIKFKTMSDKCDANGNLLPDEKRLNKIGKILRKTSLDELPQLINILKGDMSLVGPRPLLIEYLPLYNETQKRRHEIKPGITGWAQINGRNQLTYTQKFTLDIYYVDNYNLALDLSILFKTVSKVFINEDKNKLGINPNLPFDGKN